jgi:type I restriction enzyme R subunit
MEDDLSNGILEVIDMDRYRAEMRATLDIALPDQNERVDPIPLSPGGQAPEPELERLSGIVQAFNERYGNLDWRDRDRVGRLVAVDIPAKVLADNAYQNAIRSSDRENARIEHDRVLQRVMVDLMTDDTDLYRLYSDDEGFRKWLGDAVFGATYGGVEQGGTLARRGETRT